MNQVTIIIYGRNSCFYCDQAKELCEKLYERNLIYNFYVLNFNTQVKDCIEKYIEKTIYTLPQIFFDYNNFRSVWDISNIYNISCSYIGGYSDFKNWVDEKYGKIEEPEEDLNFSEMEF